MNLWKPSQHMDVVMNVVLATLGVAAWLGAEQVQLQVEALPVERIASKSTVPVDFDAHALFPVWVAARGVPLGTVAAEPLDQIFQAASVVPTDMPAAPDASGPDYPSLLAGQLRLDGVSSNGAFINGQFYRRGETMVDFQYPWQGRQVVPVLGEIGESAVVIWHGQHRTRLHL